MRRLRSPKFTKSVCLDTETINIIEDIMEEFHIDSFSNAVRFCIKGYKQWRMMANVYKTELHNIKKSDDVIREV